MSLQHKLPFSSMTPEDWLNLGMASLLLFYLFYLIWEMILRTLCAQIGVDYCAFWSAGRVANLYGYASIYDLRLLDQTEKSILPATADSSRFAVNPFPYLPIFVLPFQLFSVLTPEIGFGIWIVVNVAVMWLYLQFFARSLHQQAASTRVLLLIFASLPIYINIFTGQVDVWLAICVGEFMRALLQHKSFRAGMWLGGLVLKPQVLVLIGLVFLFQRAIRIVSGLAASASFLMIASGGLIGPVGSVQILELWLGYAKGRATNWVEGMMNWRMLGFDISNISTPWIGYGIAVASMLAMLLITLYVWRRPFDLRFPSWPIALLGILAASTSLAWHAHIHTAMILIPPLIYLHQAKLLPENVIRYWVFVPAFFFLITVFVPEGMIKFNIPSNAIYLISSFMPGFCQFAVNLGLFWWAVGASRQFN